MENLKQCPFCGRQVAADANKCLWCGKYFDTGKPEITLTVLPIWPDAKRMLILVIVALVASLISTTIQLIEDDNLIIPFSFALFVELLCGAWITLSIRGYSRRFSFGKQIPYIAYLLAATVTVAALVWLGASEDTLMSGEDSMLTVLIIAGVSLIIAAVLHIVVALKLKKQDEVQPLKEYGRITIIYSILAVFGSFIPVVNYAAIIFYSLFVYKIFRPLAQQSQVTRMIKVNQEVNNSEFVELPQKEDKSNRNDQLRVKTARRLPKSVIRVSLSLLVMLSVWGAYTIVRYATQDRHITFNEEQIMPSGFEIFINKFDADVKFRDSRIAPRVTYYHEIGSIHNGNKEGSYRVGEFNVINEQEVAYASYIPSSGDAWALIFAVVDGEWMLTEVVVM